LRQYLFAHDKEEQPFNRSEREWIDTSARNVNNTVGFCTSEVIYSIGYPILKNAAIPSAGVDTYYSTAKSVWVPCLKTIGVSHNRVRPYHPKSIVNLSAMGFGALGGNVIRAFNGGAALAGCWHNTGEGDITEYHGGTADLVWQIGTAYFGCRDETGCFSLERFQEKIVTYPQIRMIEIKLSQGAKPGRGGIVPGAKVTAEIAAIRGVPEGQDCISPNFHSAFTAVDGLIGFVEELAAVSGLPVGIKVAIGKTDFFEELAARMATTHNGPDFITIDGGEGGTGAAPLTFVDHVSLPFKIGFARVYKIFQQHGIAGDIIWIGSGKLGFPDRAIVALAMGCDLINLAREAMLSIGCIQSQKCHTGHCPTGITTQNRWLQAGLDVETKAQHFANYIHNFRKELLALGHAIPPHSLLKYVAGLLAALVRVKHHATRFASTLIGHVERFERQVRLGRVGQGPADHASRMQIHKNRQLCSLPHPETSDATTPRSIGRHHIKNGPTDSRCPDAQPEHAHTGDPRVVC
jgi:glutamate synthase domain-containing protein 2